ncbi:MAG: transcriptional regulator [Bacteroidetes bacterium CG12_big_fil_rev_8_21_14_0_65_60_17]|nr:MAG: transcriptional regulator [Bacteroidetes bacterium CG12_big_fil_rev_8_21_14_0_65_60_17]
MADRGITKLYYTISEVSRLIGEEAHVLRYWETEFQVLKPRKNRAGKRVYTRDDIDTVFRIRHLLREEKFTIEGARQALTRREDEGGEDMKDATKDLLMVRSFLTRLLDRI